MRQPGSLIGLWIVRTAGTPPSQDTLLARVQEELYVLAFSSAIRAGACVNALGAEGSPFYVCHANVESVVRQARDSGARGFIVDYDASCARFSSAHPLPPFEAARAWR
jgi:hypothetical protein